MVVVVVVVVVFLSHRDWWGFEWWKHCIIILTWFLFLENRLLYYWRHPPSSVLKSVHNWCWTWWLCCRLWLLLWWVSQQYWWRAGNVWIACVCDCRRTRDTTVNWSESPGSSHRAQQPVMTPWYSSLQFKCKPLIQCIANCTVELQVNIGMAWCSSAWRGWLYMLCSC